MDVYHTSQGCCLLCPVASHTEWKILPCSIRAHIVVQIPLPQTLWGRQSMLHSFCDGPRECQCVPAAWLSQSSHTLGMPEGVGCHLPFSVKSSLEAQMSSVFWAVPEEISTVVCHRHRDRIWGSFGKEQRRASWLKPTPSACLPPACEGSFQVSHWQWLTETLPFQVSCRMWGQEP